jgi:hypothetical protein
MLDINMKKIKQFYYELTRGILIHIIHINLVCKEELTGKGKFNYGKQSIYR